MSHDPRVVPPGDRRGLAANRRELDSDGHLVPALRLVVDHAVPDGAILIAERNGVVVLSGLVGTQRQREDAGFACWAVRGTLALQNDVVLRIQPIPPSRRPAVPMSSAPESHTLRVPMMPAESSPPPTSQAPYAEALWVPTEH